MGASAIRCPSATASRWGGWSLSGVNSFHTGLPLNVTITRKATATPDGNTSNQRPDYVVGVSPIPAGGQSINDWINIAAFATPANGAFGNVGRDTVTGPKPVSNRRGVAERHEDQ